MNCHEFVDWLQSALDSRASLRTVPSDAADHSNVCLHCQDLLASADLFTRGLGQMEAPRPPPELAQRIVRQTVKERRQARVRRTLAAAAAVGAIALLLWGLRLSLAPPVTRPESPQARGLDSESPAVPPYLEPGLSTQVAEARRATLDLTRQVAEGTARGAGWLVSTPDLLPLREFATVVETPELPVRDVGRNMTGGLEPVANSARKAWDVWLNMLPMPPDDESGL